MSQQIVKLIPIGNPESHQFVFEVVGGATGFPGYSAEEFTGTTDGSGQLTVTLSRAPAHLNGCFVLLGTDELIAAPVSIASGTHLTVQVRKLVYSKPVTPINGVSNLPSGVSIAGSATVTGDTAPTASSSASTTSGPVGGASGGAVTSVDSVSTTVSAHHHSLDSLYDHKHTLTFADASLAPATAEAVRLLVFYH